MLKNSERRILNTTPFQNHCKRLGNALCLLGYLLLPGFELSLLALKADLSVRTDVKLCIFGVLALGVSLVS